MAQAADKPVMTTADYLAWESTQEERHEFVVDKVFRMAGAEDRHSAVVGNLYVALRHHLSGTCCRTFISAMRLHVAALGNYFYPDIMVTCSAADLASPMVKSEPKLIIEVLSPSTAAYDRGLKFSHYRNLPSLQEYVLIDLDSRAVDSYTLGTDGLWVLHPFAADETVTLASVALQITAAQLFAEI
jgi:Uma2 family endonuclease